MNLNLSSEPRRVAYFAKSDVVFNINNDIYSKDECKVFALGLSATTETVPTYGDKEVSAITYVDCKIDNKNEKTKYSADASMYYQVGSENKETKYYLDTFITVGDKITSTGVGTKRVHGKTDKEIALKEYYSGLCEQQIEDVILLSYDKTIGIDASYEKLLMKKEVDEEGNEVYSAYSENKIEKLGVPAWFIKQYGEIKDASGKTIHDVAAEAIDLTSGSTGTYASYLAKAIEKAVLDAANAEMNKYSGMTVCSYEAVSGDCESNIEG